MQYTKVVKRMKPKYCLSNKVVLFVTARTWASLKAAKYRFVVFSRLHYTPDIMKASLAKGCATCRVTSLTQAIVAWLRHCVKFGLNKSELKWSTPLAERRMSFNGHVWHIATFKIDDLTTKDFFWGSDNIELRHFKMPNGRNQHY